MNNSRRWILLLAGLSVVSLALLGFVLSTWPAAARSVKGDVFSFIPLLPKNWTPPEPPGGVIRISEVHYDPLGAEPGEEWIELFNPGPAAVDLSEFKIGDEETAGGGEGMYKFPAGTQIGLGEVLIIANQAASFQSLYGFAPDFELRESDPFVPTLIKYSNWAGGTVTLLNTSDEVLVLDEQDSLVDAVSWGNSVFAFSPPAPDVAAGHSLERIPAYRDTDTADDWLDQPTPTPGAVDLSTPTPLPTANPSETPSPTPTEQTGTPPPTDDPSPSPTLSVTPGEIVLLISEVLYDPTGDEPQGEWIELFNAGTVSLDLSLYKIGDEEEAGGGEGMYAFPEGSLLASGDTAVIANRADVFSA
ncbi:MAG: lamin tail domain-containing protein, partial [Anaerolineales bacterium]|nr:lamin tail domain-containing protein [Anaerolineales bacterium]